MATAYREYNERKKGLPRTFNSSRMTNNKARETCASNADSTAFSTTKEVIWVDAIENNTSWLNMIDQLNIARIPVPIAAASIEVK
jgi:hypothetical protein